ncbi:DEAD/DEAH box helicase [Microtetraspora malaysiensis]|uniref:DEAD/DEAH box helicase n=1 Tax=Microtetraspora malaysiensis TaxID=161358 RepID=UPI000A8B4CA6|nr:DEAD/DEAH box helicase [Microtetraspora malaysiensis]
MSVSAASHLSPSYPDRAAWGTATKLRAWQQEAFDLYFRREPRDFLTVATPGAGKTTYALRIASELLSRGIIKAVTVVTPTEHLKRQWADAASRVGIAIDPEFKNSQGATSRDFTGVAITYAQVAMHPALHRARTEARKTLVIFDEIHHAGDAKSWGDGVREAFEPATRRLSLTGTPFRSDDSPIPFVTYVEDGDGTMRSASDYSYGYGPALRDGVVRPVIFLAYSGEMKWRTRAGDEIAATLGTPLTKDQLSQAWRAALDPKGDWIRQVIHAADRRLTEVRRGVPDAGGLIIASDHESARAYARHIRTVAGEGATIVLSDDPDASKKIKEFTASQARWLVAVRMVSEGVDIPRLSVGVYATSTSTPLFFAQAVGRFVRARKRGEMASVFVPSVPVLMGLAAEMEEERDHVLGRAQAEDGLDDSLLERAQQERNQPDALGDELPFQTLEASATFDRVLFDGGEFGTAAAPGSPEEEDFIGLPGLLEPDQVASLLRRRQADQQAAKRRKGAPEPAPALAPHEQMQELRKELNGLVGAWNHRTGQPHGVIHAELRRSCGGPAIAQASAEQIKERIAMIRKWATQRR